MYESPRLVSINTINAAYGQGLMSMGTCTVNVNVNANAGVNVNAGANVNVGANANAIAIVLVVNHYSPIGAGDPRCSPLKFLDTTTFLDDGEAEQLPPLTLGRRLGCLSS
jgi:hypothetical protein